MKGIRPLFFWGGQLQKYRNNQYDAAHEEDGQSWLNGWPIKDRTNYPLLFDRDFKRKKAYDRYYP